MSDFKAKMHRIRFWLGSAPDPTGGAYSAPPDPLTKFKGPTSTGREVGKGEKRGEGRGDFNVARFNDVVSNTTGNRIIPEIDMAVIQTGSKSCLSLHDSCKRNSNCYTHLS